MEKQRVFVNLNKDQAEALDEIARKRFSSRSAVARLAIDQFLRQRKNWEEETDKVYGTV